MGSPGREGGRGRSPAQGRGCPRGRPGGCSRACPGASLCPHRTPGHVERPPQPPAPHRPELHRPVPGKLILSPSRSHRLTSALDVLPGEGSCLLCPVHIHLRPARAPSQQVPSPSSPEQSRSCSPVTETRGRVQRGCSTCPWSHSQRGMGRGLEALSRLSKLGGGRLGRGTRRWEGPRSPLPSKAQRGRPGPHLAAAWTPFPISQHPPPALPGCLCAPPPAASHSYRNSCSSRRSGSPDLAGAGLFLEQG